MSGEDHGDRTGHESTFPRWSWLTFEAEGGGREKVARPHWPGSSSGVTIGAGLDLYQWREPAKMKQVEAWLVEAGLDAERVARLLGAADLRMKQARAFERANKDIVLEAKGVETLFRRVYAAKVEYTRRVVNGAYWKGSFDAFDARVREMLVDLVFRGDLNPAYEKVAPKLRDPIRRGDEEAFIAAIRDVAYWSKMTSKSLPLGRHGEPHDRVLRRANFFGGPSKTPDPREPPAARSDGTPTKASSSSAPRQAVSCAPQGSNAVNAVRFSADLRLLVLDCYTAEPTGLTVIDRVEIDGAAIAPPPRHRTRAGAWMTEIDGSLVIPVPLARALQGFRVAVHFHDFAVVPEASLREVAMQQLSPCVFRTRSSSASSQPPPIELSAEWEAPPSSAPQGVTWGWRLRDLSTPRHPRATLPEFRTVVEWEIPACPVPGLWTTIPTADDPFSVHHVEAGQPELVVFAMRYCQPVFFEPEGIAGVACGSHGGAGRVVDPASLVRRPTQLMTSRWTAPPQVTSGGRDFGSCVQLSPGMTTGTRVGDNGQWRAHKGIDVAGREGQTPVFAICAGRVVHAAPSNGGYGYQVIQRIDEHHVARYAHLAAAPSVRLGELLRPGQLIGLVGRTSNIAATGVATKYPAYSPTHLHLEISSGAGVTDPRIEPRKWLDLIGYNPGFDLFPHNEMPRLFPCDCETPDGVAKHCANRPDGHNTEVAQGCWAHVHHCPYERARP